MKIVLPFVLVGLLASCVVEGSDDDTLAELSQGLVHESASFVAPEPGPSWGQGFGHSVAVVGDRLVVGSPSELTHGAVHVYRRGRAQWELEAILQPDVPAGHELFGQQVAFDGNRIAVSSRHDTRWWAVYVFERVGSTWTQVASLPAPYPTQSGIPERGKSSPRTRRWPSAAGPWWSAARSTPSAPTSSRRGRSRRTAPSSPTGDRRRASGR